MRLLFLFFLIANSTNSVAAWKYEKSKDGMAGSIYTASVNSRNSLNFSFPYSGSQKATLALRDHPRWGVSVIISIRQGQFACSHDSCAVLVKFDDDINTWLYRIPSDNSHDTIFIAEKFDFINVMMRSKKMLIEADFFHEGRQILEFDISKLKWPLVNRELQY